MEFVWHIPYRAAASHTYVKLWAYMLWVYPCVRMLMFCQRLGWATVLSCGNVRVVLTQSDFPYALMSMFVRACVLA